MPARNETISDYDPSKLEIEQCSIRGVRIDRVHGQEYRVKPRLYLVREKNLPIGGQWLVQLHEKHVVEGTGDLHKATIVSLMLAPLRASNRMTALTRQSIMIQPASSGKHVGKPYAHITFRPPGQRGGKKTAVRGQKDHLPGWFLQRYKRKIRLRRTVKGNVQSDSNVGKRLGKYHDIKEVVVFDEWDDVEFVRYFFMMRIFSAFHGFSLEPI